MMSGPHETIAIPHAEMLAQTILALGLPMQHVFLGVKTDISRFWLPSSKALQQGPTRTNPPMGKNNQTQNQDSELPAMVCLGGWDHVLGDDKTLEHQSHSDRTSSEKHLPISGSGKQRQKALPSLEMPAERKPVVM